ncbi:NAD-dependent epimerase/dehydratase family protein [Frigoriflavimonas asaccharolytica]|uniref:Nucleoside-diphosphate-sugar epimerase n=1 Tax=Frigoriflavimonas asaccharolytica TaxID=2735899 RepID=A0A8J8G5R4_9FLAO|nr:NAD-dependent epimerase/dehydratase family protein [Frigoriflavimonas asaccharolytica]NRS91978.1 nucleoside-diphosphate-sugar epimerase [Frigoriflavimonas asaccharolytica]
MILITGATGILGRVVVLELLKSGKQVRACKRATSNVEDVRNSFKFYTENPDEYYNKIEWVDVDFEDAESLKTALENVTEIYHCAGKVSFHPKDKKELHQNNIKFTEQLLYACENSSVQNFCYISSIAVLDGVNDSGEIDETCDYNPKISHSAYAASKHFAEMEVWRASAEGLNTVILNPGVILGSGNWKNSSGTLFSTFIKNKFTFSGGTAYVDVRDVAKIALELMDNKHFGERFVVVAENKNFVTIADQIREKVGLSKTKLLPMFLLNIGRILNILLGWLISPLKMISKPNIEAVSTNTKVSNKKLLKTINYPFISIQESVEFHLNNYISDHKK